MRGKPLGQDFVGWESRGRGALEGELTSLGESRESEGQRTLTVGGA